MKYTILAGKKGDKHKMVYRDPFTGKDLKGDKATVQKIWFLLTTQYPDEEFEIEEIK